MNYHYTIKKFKLQGFPVYTLELVFSNEQPEIADAMHVYGNSYMFHKELLYRILEKRIPENYTKLAFLDCDLIFSNVSWYKQTSELLDRFDVVQPFEFAEWLDLTYKM